jgi:hypothetical protein
MPKDRRVITGNVAFTFTNGPKSATFTLQTKMELRRLTTGTPAQPLEEWEMTVSRTFIASKGFETRIFDEDKPRTFPYQIDMRADTEDWCAALKKLILSPSLLEKMRKQYTRRLKAKRGSYKIGDVWEE